MGLWLTGAVCVYGLILPSSRAHVHRCLLCTQNPKEAPVGGKADGANRGLPAEEIRDLSVQYYCTEQVGITSILFKLKIYISPLVSLLANSNVEIRTN